MLVTDAGKLIRCPVDDVRIAGRNTQGVRIFKTEESEKVVSVERIPDDGNGVADNGNGNGDGEARAARARGPLDQRHNCASPECRAAQYGDAIAPNSSYLSIPALS